MAREIKVALLGDSKSLERAFSRSASASGDLHGKMGILGRSASAAGDMLKRGLQVGALGAAGGMAVAMKMAGDYQQKLSVFQATAGATGDQMKIVSKLALKLGADTKLPATSAADAAEAMTMLARGGLKVGASMKAARGVLQLSAAAQISNAEAADITAKALNAFGLAGEHAADVANQLAGATRAGVPVQDMGLALKAASAVAKQFGLDLGDTTTALVELGQAGITGSDAGTSLKTMLMSLTPVGAPAAKAMKDLGVSVKDAHGNFLPFPKIIDQFKSGLSELSPYQQQFALKTIFGSDATRAANIILGKGSKAYLDLRARVTAAGQAQKLADAQTKGFNGAMQGLKSTVETLAIAIGLKVLPVATKFLGFLTKVAGSPSLSVAIKVVWDGIKTFAANAAEVIGEALFGSSKVVHIGGGSPHVVADPGLIKSMSTSITEAIKGVNWTEAGKAIAKGVGEATKGHSKDASWQATASTFYNDLIPALDSKGQEASRKIGQIVGTVISAGVGLAFKAVTQHPGEVLAGGVQLFNLLQRAISFPMRALSSFLRGVFQGTIGKAITEFGPTVTKAASDLGKRIVSGVVGGLQGIGAAVLGKITQVTNEVNQVAQNIWQAASRIGARIISGVLAGLAGLGSALKNKIESVIGGVLDHVNIPGHSPPEHAAAEAIGAPLGRGVILGFLAGSRDLPEKISSKLQASLESARNRIEGLRASFATSFGRLGSDAMSAFDATTAKKLDGISAKFQKWRDKAAKTLAGVMGGIDAGQRELTPSEQALQDLTAGHDQAGRNADAARGQADLAAATTPEEVAAAQKEIDDAAYNQRIFDLGVLAAAERAKVDADAETARQTAQAAFDEQNTAWDAQQAKETLDLQSQRDLKKRHLEDMLTDLQENLAKHPKAWRKAHAKIMKMFEEDFGPDFQAAGANLGSGFRASLTEDFQVTAGLLGDVGSAILRVLSPENQAAVGAAAAAKKPKKLAAGGIVTSPTFALIGEAGPEAVIPLSRGGGGGGTTINVTVQGWVGNDQEIAERIRNALIRTGRNTTGGALGRFA